MVIDSFEVRSGTGTKLSCKSLLPKDPPKAVLFIVHGLGEHKGRYEALVNLFVENQIAVFIYDQRGHGQSEGKRGHAVSVDQLIEDMEHVLMHCRSLFLELSIFLYGHSMGGQIVASYLDKKKSNEIDGAIISSAWFRLANPPPDWQLALVNKLATFMPRLTLSNRLNPSDISSVPGEVEMYQKDPQIHDKISLVLSNSLIQNGKRLAQQAQIIKIPVLVCHGDKDQITSISASKQYAIKIGEKAGFKIWAGAFHESHHDFEKEMVMRFYVDWVTGIIDK